MTKLPRRPPPATGDARPEPLIVSYPSTPTVIRRLGGLVLYLGRPGDGMTRQPIHRK